MVKLQIGSVEVLNRLIGGDSEIEVEIRNSVVQNFAHRHLKAVINDPTISGHMEDLKRKVINEIDAIFKEKFGIMVPGTYSYSNNVFKIRQDVKNSLEDAADNAAGKIIREYDQKVQTQVEEILAKRLTESKIEEFVNKRLNIDVEKIVRDKVDARLAQIKSSLA